MQSGIKKAIVILIVIAAAVILVPFVYIEYTLISDRYTDFSDIVSVYNVNHGSKYEVLSTVEGELEQFNENDPDRPYFRNAEQVVMTRDLSEFLLYIEEKGCTKYDQQGSIHFYRTANGKNVVIIHEMHNGVFYDYNIFRLQGLTIDEIIGK